MTKFTIEQHRMMEQLSGKQYTRSGKLWSRNRPRSYNQSVKLGLIEIKPLVAGIDYDPDTPDGKLKALLRKIK